MSLRAELLRLGLRLVVKPGNSPRVTIARLRERTARFARRAPMPPAGTETLRGELGGIAVLRVATPSANPERHILFLHGGGYVIGSPELYRHITWRFASAARARVAAIDYRLAPEHPFPAALDDAVAAWHGLLDEGAEPHSGRQRRDPSRRRRTDGRADAPGGMRGGTRNMAAHAACLACLRTDN